MSENICPSCGFTNRESARFCAKCASPLLGGASTAPPAEPVGLQPGTILQGRYRIERELGRGGFGAVYRAWDMNLNKHCAVKENLETSPEAQRQFTREAIVLANLSHPNLPRVTDHFILPEQGQYLVMDFVEGEDLVSVIRRQGVVPPEQAVTWVVQVAEALEYLHSRTPPVVHRDIKPANIRITLDNRAVLVDFGLVKVSAPHAKTTLGARAVTPGYAPPEQYGQGSTDERTDIYALGATLFSLVTGKDPVESVQRMVGTLQPAAQSLNPAVPSALSQVIERAMSVYPEQRYQSAGEFKAALLQAMAASAAAQPAFPGRGSTVLVSPGGEMPSAAPTPAFSTPRSPVAGTVVVGERPLPGSAPTDWAPPAAPPAASRRSGANLWLGVGGGILLLLCLGIGLIALLAKWAADRDQQATQTAQALALSQTAVSQAEATRQAQQTATAQAQIIAQKPTTTPTASGGELIAGLQWDLIFFDPFDDNSHSWPVKTSFSSESEITWSIESGKYRWQAQATDGYSWWVCYDDYDLSRYYYAAEAFAIRGYDLADHGIIFHCSHPNDQYQLYLFLIRHPDQFAVYAYQNGDWNRLYPWTTTTALFTNRPNRLAVLADEGVFQFFINDQPVATLSDDQLPSGGFGMLVSINSVVSTAIWEFDNVELRVP